MKKELVEWTRKKNQETYDSFVATLQEQIEIKKQLKKIKPKMTPTKKPPPLGEKWRRTKIKAELIDQEVRQLPFIDLSSRELFVAQNKCDRTFDNGTPSGQNKCFKLTCNHCKEFGATPTSLLSKAGYESMMKNFRQNLNYSQSWIDEQKHYSENKRKILEARTPKLWSNFKKAPELFLRFEIDSQALPRNLFRENKKIADVKRHKFPKFEKEEDA